tara:strand:+ start:444 stop:563 length:120 start_codon:yes stop_codon:yes gene_type:complete
MKEKKIEVQQEDLDMANPSKLPLLIKAVKIEKKEQLIRP